MNHGLIDQNNILIQDLFRQITNSNTLLYTYKVCLKYQLQKCMFRTYSLPELYCADTMVNSHNNLQWASNFKTVANRALHSMVFSYLQCQILHPDIVVNTTNAATPTSDSKLSRNSWRVSEAKPSNQLYANHLWASWWTKLHSSHGPCIQHQNILPNPLDSKNLVVNPFYNKYTAMCSYHKLPNTYSCIVYRIHPVSYSFVVIFRCMPVTWYTTW